MSEPQFGGVDLSEPTVDIDLELAPDDQLESGDPQGESPTVGESAEDALGENDPNAYTETYQWKDGDLWGVQKDPLTGEETERALSDVLAGGFKEAWDEIRASGDFAFDGGAVEFDVRYPESDREGEEAFLKVTLEPPVDGNVVMSSETEYRTAEPKTPEDDSNEAVEEGKVSVVETEDDSSDEEMNRSVASPGGADARRPAWLRPHESTIAPIEAFNLIDHMEQAAAGDDAEPPVEATVGVVPVSPVRPAPPRAAHIGAATSVRSTPAATTQISSPDLSHGVPVARSTAERIATAKSEGGIPSAAYSAEPKSDVGSTEPMDEAAFSRETSPEPLAGTHEQSVAEPAPSEPSSGGAIEHKKSQEQPSTPEPTSKPERIGVPTLAGSERQTPARREVSSPGDTPKTPSHAIISPGETVQLHRAVSAPEATTLQAPAPIERSVPDTAREVIVVDSKAAIRQTEAPHAEIAAPSVAEAPGVEAVVQVAPKAETVTTESAPLATVEEAPVAVAEAVTAEPVVVEPAAGAQPLVEATSEAPVEVTDLVEPIADVVVETPVVVEAPAMLESPAALDVAVTAATAVETVPPEVHQYEPVAPVALRVPVEQEITRTEQVASPIASSFEAAAPSTSEVAPPVQVAERATDVDLSHPVMAEAPVVHRAVSVEQVIPPAEKSADQTRAQPARRTEAAPAFASWAEDFGASEQAAARAWRTERTAPTLANAEAFARPPAAAHSTAADTSLEITFASDGQRRTARRRARTRSATV